MIRTKAQKQELVTTLAAKLKRSPTLYITDFTGLNVARITDLRRRLRAAGVEYVVVKNTLALRAFSEAQVTGVESHLDGPTALVLAGADAVAPAKILHDFAKEFEKPRIKIGLWRASRWSRRRWRGSRRCPHARRCWPSSAGRCRRRWRVSPAPSTDC